MIAESTIIVSVFEVLEDEKIALMLSLSNGMLLPECSYLPPWVLNWVQKTCIIILTNHNAPSTRPTWLRLVHTPLNLFYPWTYPNVFYEFM